MKPADQMPNREMRDSDLLLSAARKIDDALNLLDIVGIDDSAAAYTSGRACKRSILGEWSARTGLRSTL